MDFDIIKRAERLYSTIGLDWNDGSEIVIDRVRKKFDKFHRHKRIIAGHQKYPFRPGVRKCGVKSAERTAILDKIKGKRSFERYRLNRKWRFLAGDDG